MTTKGDFTMQPTFLINRTIQSDTNINLPSARAIGSIVAAAVITFSLFVIMQKLIHQDSIFVGDPNEIVIPNVFLADDLDSPTNTKNSLPEKPKMMEQPKPIPTQPETPDEIATIATFSMARPTLSIEKSAVGFSNGGNDARPLVRIQPRYPIQAARDGIEGWVELEFTIDSSGTVKDVKVTDSEPKRVFDTEAKRALRKWKYKPQMVDGRATELPSMQVVLEFKLES